MVLQPHDSKRHMRWAGRQDAWLAWTELCLSWRPAGGVPLKGVEKKKKKKKQEVVEEAAVEDGQQQLVQAEEGAKAGPSGLTSEFKY